MEKCCIKAREEVLGEVKKMVKRLKDSDDTESRGWGLFFHGKRGKENHHCCPGDDYGWVYEKALADLQHHISKMRNNKTDV